MWHETLLQIFIRRLFKCFSKIKYKFETQTTINIRRSPSVTFTLELGYPGENHLIQWCFQFQHARTTVGWVCFASHFPCPQVRKDWSWAPRFQQGPTAPGFASIFLEIKHTTWTLNTCQLYLCCTKATLFYNIFKFYFQYLPTAHYIRSRFHHSIPYHGFFHRQKQRDHLQIENSSRLKDCLSRILCEISQTLREANLAIWMGDTTTKQMCSFLFLSGYIMMENMYVQQVSIQESEKTRKTYPP